MVVLSHCLNEYGSYGFGGSFVDVFFVVSGVVIAGTRSNNFILKNFMKRRILRIYPSYLIATFLTIAAMYLTGKNFYIDEILRSLLLFPSFGENIFYPILKVGWSLAYEMFFYIFFGLTIYFQVVFKLRIMTLVFLGCAYFLSDVYILEFWAGTVIYHISKLIPNNVNRNQSYFYLIACLGIILIGYGEVMKSIEARHSTQMLFLGAVLLVGGTYQTSINLTKLSWLGKNTSYEVYLFHPLVINTVLIFGDMVGAEIGLNVLFLLTMLSVHIVIFLRKKLIWLPGD